MTEQELPEAVETKELITLDPRLLHPIHDLWEREKLTEMCEQHTDWQSFGAVYVSRGYLQTMRPDTSARVAILVAVNPKPLKPEVPEEDQTSPGAEALSRRGIARR